MKKLVAVLGATILSLGLVAACDQASGSDDVSGSPGLVGDGGDAARDDSDIDLQEWLDDYVAANSRITTVHAVIDQDITAGGTSVTNHMELDMDATRPAFSMTMDMLGLLAEVIIVDGAAYVDVGTGFQQMTLEELDMSESDLNPAADVERQRDAITKVDLVGSETVDGVETKHYVVTYDVAEMNKLLDPADGSVQGNTLTMDFWLDDDMRPIKLTTDMTVKSGGATSTVKQEVVYSDYGKPVTIEAPM